MKTAEEFLLEKQKELGYNPLIDIKRASVCLQEFAKFHVTEALKAAHRNFQVPEEELDFTLDCYPLKNII